MGVGVGVGVGLGVRVGVGAVQVNKVPVVLPLLAVTVQAFAAPVSMLGALHHQVGFRSGVQHR